MKKRTLANSGQRIVVTGMGVISPLGLDVESTWSALTAGKSGAGTITHFDPSNFDVRFACEVKGFDPLKYIPKKDLRRMDRFIQLGFSAAMQAIEQAGLDTTKVPAERIGVTLSSGIGGLPMIEEQHRILLERADRVSPFFIPSTIANLLAGQVSIAKGFKGPNHCVVSACSSSAHAIGEAMRLLERGDCDAVVAGGAESTISPLGIQGFASMKALSKRNDAPEKASRPFDTERDGFVMGEGAAVVILETLAGAQKRGATILGEFVGYALNSDAYHMTSPSEGGEGAAHCMALALEDANLKPTDVDYINMHGTSTGAGDVAESLAIERLFGEHAKNINCSSTKSMTGHLLGAAGALEGIFSMLAVQRGVIPPTINLDHQDPQCRLNYTANHAQKRDAKVALSNSFGFGGTNATLVIRKYPT
ncbi:MAG: beta-ketoacyl-ACP synthase II [Bdellovibrionales bacterium]|nr:beta-ketoacyl-ACP synthase II [Bdellovibrionales bacterium]